jgi:hypothetical protein
VYHSRSVCFSKFCLVTHGENRPYLATPDREIGSCTQSPQMCWHVPLTTSGVRYKLSYLRDTVNDGTLIIQ